jgi:hypothetical protein
MGNSRGGETIMDICQFCGWEIKNPAWYNYYNHKPLCDDCNMDIMTERQKEMEAEMEKAQ